MMDFKYRVILFLIVAISGGALVTASDELPSKSLKGLSAEDFGTREASYEDLKKWAEENFKDSPEILHGFWKKQKNPEVAVRADALMRGAFEFRVKKQGSGFVGISLGIALMRKGQELIQGTRIVSVRPGLAGEKAGLSAGDIVVGLDGEPMEDLIKEYSRELGEHVSATTAFIYYIMMQSPKRVVSMKIIRAEQEIVKKVTLIARPEATPPHPSQITAVNQILLKQWLEKLAR